jgi:hypothetical protein
MDCARIESPSTKHLARSIKDTYSGSLRLPRRIPGSPMGGTPLSLFLNEEARAAY